MELVLIPLLVLTTYLILSKRVNDGLIIKLGLAVQGIGLVGMLAGLYEACGIKNQSVMAIMGFTIVLLGIGFKVYQGRHKRVSDWFSVEKHFAGQDRRRR